MQFADVIYDINLAANPIIKDEKIIIYLNGKMK